MEHLGSYAIEAMDTLGVEVTQILTKKFPNILLDWLNAQWHSTRYTTCSTLHVSKIARQGFLFVIENPMKLCVENMVTSWIQWYWTGASWFKEGLSEWRIS